MRFLLIFAALAIIVLVARRLWGRKTPQRNRDALAGKMIQCAECGIYIPEQEAVRDGEHAFCSAAHRDNFRNNPGAGK